MAMKTNVSQMICPIFQVAIKIMDTRKIKEEYTRNNLHREARILGQIRHPNIIRLYETLKVSLFIFHRRDYLRNQYVSYAYSQANGTKPTLFQRFIRVFSSKGY